MSRIHCTLLCSDPQRPHFPQPEPKAPQWPRRPALSRLIASSLTFHPTPCLSHLPRFPSSHLPLQASALAVPSAWTTLTPEDPCPLQHPLQSGPPLSPPSSKDTACPSFSQKIPSLACPRFLFAFPQHLPLPKGPCRKHLAGVHGLALLSLQAPQQHRPLAVADSVSS